MRGDKMRTRVMAKHTPLTRQNFRLREKDREEDERRDIQGGLEM